MQGKTYFIGDLHLDHANIIKYCSRPFASAEEMNKVLVDNWNSTVQKTDFVYFLGDISYGKGSRNADYWFGELNGTKRFIRGNHDKKMNVPYVNHDFFKLGETQFLLIHDPEKLQFKWDSWIIHGHYHTNEMEKYPFINGEKKTINVSVELTDYKPVSLEFLVSLDIETIKRMDTVSSEIVRK
jgi:calcineurin-like phosphoesterase family protein